MKNIVMNFRWLGIAVCSLVLLAGSLSASKPIARDMVLIYSGGAHRGVWDKAKFEPYVSYENERGERDWLFDGFLFLEIKDGKGRGFASYYEKEGARKVEWKRLLDDYFTPGRDLHALNDCIEEARANGSGAFSARKVVIGLPEPIPNQKDWGEVNGESLDFSRTEDRLVACRWFIDYAIRRFETAGLRNLELSGFYWIAEEATNSRGLARQVGDYVREKGLNFNWIPYFRSDGFQEWEKLGFDIAYLQPNYFFNEKIAEERLDDACSLGKEYGMCMEMEFDERALKKGKFGYRLENYIKAFDKYGVFAHLPVAYYQGNTAFYDLFHSEEPEDNRLYEELARRIAQRQKMEKMEWRTLSTR